MKYFKKIVGDRIYLSPMSTEDAEIFTQWLNDFDTTDYLGRSGMITTLSGEQEYLENKTKNENEAKFAIVTLDGDKLRGTVSLEHINLSNKDAILGIFIGDKDYRNNGYGTEAIKLILDYGFNYINLHSVRLDVMAFNERAQKCYQKCGFKEYGRIRQCRYVDGKYYDIVGMDILKEEFSGSYIRNKNI